MEHEANPCGCKRDIGSSKAHIPQTCEHGNLLRYTKALGSNGRKPLRKSSEKGEGEVRRRGSILNRGRGFSASPAQQDKVKRLPCIVCGRDGLEVTIDPAHVYPRRLQSCECAEGVVPLCRECHGLYDDPSRPFDLLRHLVTRGYHPELVHAVAVHQVPIRELLDQVTGVKWAPIQLVASADREPPKREAATAAQTQGGSR